MEFIPERVQNKTAGIYYDKFKSGEVNKDKKLIIPYICNQHTIFSYLIRLKYKMDGTKYDLMTEKRNNEVNKTVKKEHNRLFNFIRKYVGNIEDAKDILQDVMYQFIVSYDDIRSVEQTTSWLFTVARNRITDLFRKKKLEAFSDLITPDDDGNVLMIEDILPDEAMLPDDEYFFLTIWDIIEETMEELPSEQKEVFIMNEIEGRSFKEIAEITGVQVNTLLSRKRYAVLYLRNKLKDFFNDLYIE